MFITSFGFHFLSLTNLVIKPLTLLPSITLRLSSRIYDRLGDTHNSLHLFQTSKHLVHYVKVFSSLGSSNHSLISVSEVKMSLALYIC